MDQLHQTSAMFFLRKVFTLRRRNGVLLPHFGDCPNLETQLSLCRPYPGPALGRWGYGLAPRAPRSVRRDLEAEGDGRAVALDEDIPRRAELPAPDSADECLNPTQERALCFFALLASCWLFLQATLPACQTACPPARLPARLLAFATFIIIVCWLDCPFKSNRQNNGQLLPNCLP